MKKHILFILFLTIFASLQTFAQSTSNPDTVCMGSEVYYKIANPTANSSFTWGIYNNKGTITFGAGTDSIRVAWNNTEGIDSLWVYETNFATCSGDTSKLTVVRVAPPTAEFDNSQLCYGEKLNIIFIGNPPYNVEYTLNGNTVTQNGITQNPYPLTEAGNYELIKVSNKHCNTSSLTGTVNAVIAQPLQKLQIYHE